MVIILRGPIYQFTTLPMGRLDIIFVQGFDRNLKDPIRRKTTTNALLFKAKMLALCLVSRFLVI